MNKQIITTLSIAAALLIAACGGGNHESASTTTTTASSEQPKSAAADPGSYDPKRGEGKYDESNVTVGPLDAAMAAKGKAVAETKCFSCHKTSEEKLVGPGWKGVTSRHPAHWIMNFITNPDPMINKDPEVQAQLEICLVRMPNQNLAEQEARDIVEFMRQNDGAK
ncbi:c-type cytochrome [Chitinophaga eiseniae]|uniref:Cytochrome c n=1 Tax=Chitinophaga eiseniae TaxID=634771 RepID=A0A847SM41_9BACT|nr:cytochrome c [Chitinophaga eiseniae]NLR78219.1 cytochrome c [Chitinophaga eiseniae]